MNPRFAAVEPSLIREVNSRKKPGDIDLGLGEPVLRPDMGPLQRALDWIAENGCPYTPNAGSLELREAVARYVGSEAKRVVVTHGSQEAVYVAIRIVIDAAVDEVLIVEPAYPAYAKICEVEGIRWRAAALDPNEGFAPRADAVISALSEQTRLVVLSSPCNPTGRVWPRAELERLAAALPDGCYVLSDEVYRELYYGDVRPASMAELFARTIVAGGLSKSHALTGLRVGWIVCPDELVASATRAHQLLTTAASTFSQRAAIEVLADGVPHQAVYRERHASLVGALREAGVEFIMPEGAFYCLIRLPDGRGSLETAMRLIDEAHVVTVPGIAFGKACEGWLRISWVSDAQVVREGISRIAGGLVK